MTTPRAAGRPKAISREMLEEAACELFLEQGYEATSVADITRRAGVSRATFFNYVDSKAGLLWASIDDVLAGLEATLEPAEGEAVGDPKLALREASRDLHAGVAVLAMRNADAMRVVEELARTGAERQARLARALAPALRAQGLDPLAADVQARAYAGAFFAALEAWASGDPGAEAFGRVLERALAFL